MSSKLLDRETVKGMFKQEWYSRWLQVLLVAVMVTCGSIATSAQSSNDWVRHYRGKFAFFVTRDPRFAADIHRYLAQLIPCWGQTKLLCKGDLAATASSYMTNSTDDAVQFQGELSTVWGCGNHGGECAMFWSSSTKSTSRKPSLALCIIADKLWVYTSGDSDRSMPPQLRHSIQSWRKSLEEEGFFMRPEAAFLVTRDGKVHALTLDTLNPQVVK